jgi:hypothetical protein
MLKKLAVVDPLLVTPPLPRVKRKREQDDPEQPPADMTRRQFEEIPVANDGTDCRRPCAGGLDPQQVSCTGRSRRLN